MRFGWEMCDPPGAVKCIVLTVRILPPPPLVDHWCAWRELYIYWSLRNNFSVHSVAVTLSCYTVVLTTSSSTSSPYFFLPITRTIWSDWTRPDCPPCVSSVLSAFDRLFQCPASCLTVPKPSDLSGLDPDNPPWLAVYPLSVFLEQLMYTIHSALLYILHSNSFQFSFLHSVKFCSSNACFS